ncbi:zinc-binding alcohol dehydrogenase family protein [Aspergillus brunneoviolaceus CBS 621.78]|uniref:Oxidoreductase n=1 Tax=Aspergillus brunneoviolaceus CBS 621.78 TaxID=1450534 RepID=A0ACD1GAK7_9EURO|nr:oxidoreductase [Aspergillus brunneoviolaceus CBS 621.78]RAH46240.1 oxidoreductase [Aspergillus brunneoviolaceus CBS 621.78]
MTTIATYTVPSSLDDKYPLVYDSPVRVEQRYYPESESIEAPAPAPTQAAPQATQSALLLHGIGQEYTLVTDHAIPSILGEEEILVKIQAIGLNPIDWKGPAYNFGIPALPWINGRDLAGVVVAVRDPAHPRIRVGDRVLVPSTDYRDIRKAAFQQYAVATHFNAARIPDQTGVHVSASLGVAFVASTLALGVSLGLDFSTIAACPGPNLVDAVQSVDAAEIPADVWEECFSAVPAQERLRRGEWLVIWGASTTTGMITLQLAKLAGLKVLCVADVARHGARLHALGADVLVDRHDPARAVEIIRGVTGGGLRYAVDIVGRETATLLQGVLDATVREDGSHAHLLGLTGLPKERRAGIKYHTVPIKLFHSSVGVGEKMVAWLEELLASNTLLGPEVVRHAGGLEGVNAALDTLRQGSVSGKRIVVDLEG